MKYCTKCKVNVHHQQTNCPLCGAYLDEADNNLNNQMYTEMDSVVKYPKLVISTKRPFFRTKFNKLLVALMLFSVLLNIIVTPDSLWSAYVTVSIIFVIFGVMLPINRRSKIVNIIKAELFWITVCAIAFELIITKGKFAWLTVEYILPWVYCLAVVLLDLLIIFLRKKNRQLFSTLITATFFAALPQIVLWIVEPIGWYQPKTIIDFVVFLSALLNAVFMFIICSRSMKEEMERNLNI
ncbi:MAG: hypothetical protein IJZ28_03975 [Clostridia bacterium]|nr:hypothetical protein [Clostridia bacterium]MBQ8772340.1 hypothetical protein [Clostridia bacterium]MBQ8873007.1 hypothetical protein [Clostridia bacterium]